MRISDWSSDVCSSDLRNCHGGCPNNHYTAANDTAVYCPPRSSAVGGFNRSRQPGDGLRRGGERQDDGHALLGRRAAKGGAPPIMAGGASRHFESFHLSERLDCCWRSGGTGLEGFGGSPIGGPVAFLIGPYRRGRKEERGVGTGCGREGRV